MQYLSRGKHLLNQLCLNSLFSKPQHPDKGGREEILLHCLLLANISKYLHPDVHYYA